MQKRSLNFATSLSSGNNSVSVSKTPRARKPPAGRSSSYALNRSATSSQRVWTSLLKNSFLILYKHTRLSPHSRQCSVTLTQIQPLTIHPHPHATVSLPISPNFLTNPYLHRHPEHPNPYPHNNSLHPFPRTAGPPETSQSST